MLILVSFILSLAIPNIGDAMTILGATTNSGIGFILPIIYYLKLRRKLPTWSNEKLIAYCVFGFVCLSSVIEIGTFVYKRCIQIESLRLVLIANLFVIDIFLISNQSM